MRSKSCEVNARILLLTKLWLDGAYGVTTARRAAQLADCSESLIDAARIVLQSEDEALVEAVLAGHVALTAAAAEAYRHQVQLIQSKDHVALVRALNPGVANGMSKPRIAVPVNTH